ISSPCLGAVENAVYVTFSPRLQFFPRAVRSERSPDAANKDAALQPALPSACAIGQRCVFLMKRKQLLLLLLCTFTAIATALNCAPSDNGKSDNQLKGPGRIQWAQFYDPFKPQAINPPIQLRTARNETISFALQFNSLPDFNSRR